MKIKNLTIHNIASIADAYIDFESPALSSADIFLITGNTGSGKSTILDCICLALYNTAPRLKGTLMEGRLEQKGDYNGISLSDSRQMMRRNSGECFVELVFEGNNGLVYTARWSTQRAYCRPGGRLQKTVHNFVCGAKTFTGDTLREERLAAVGMGYDEFVRTTMLAQGEFTRFLNCSDKEKADVLMQILSVDAYEKIGRRIHQRTASEKEILEQLKAKADSLDLLSPDQRQVLEEEKTAVTNRCSELRAAYETDSRRLAWFRDGADIARHLAGAQAALDAAAARCESEEYIRNSRFIADYDSAADVLVLLRQAFDIRKSLKECVIQRKKLASRFKSCSSGLALVEQQVADIERQNKDVSKWLESNAPLEYTTERSLLVAGNVRNYFAARRRLTVNSSMLEELLKELELKNCEQKIASENVHKATEALEAARQICTALQKAFAEKNPDELQRRESELVSRGSALEIARNLDGMFQSCAAELKAAVDKADALRVGMSADTLAVESAEKSMAAMQEKFDSHQNLYDKAAQSMSDWSRRMRSQLTVGDVCPVCRRRIDEAFESDNQILQALEPLRLAVDDARAQLVGAVEKLNAARVALTTRHNLVASAEAEVVRRRLQCDAAKDRLQKHCSTLGIESAAIEQEVHKCAARRRDLLPLLEDVRELKTRCDAARLAADKLAVEKEGAEALLKKYADTLADLNGRKASLEALIASERSLMEEFSKKLSVDVRGPWKCAWHEAPKEFLAELDAAVAARREATEKREALTREYDRLTAVVTICRSAAQAVKNLMPAWGSEIPEFRPVLRLEEEFSTLKVQTEANIATERELNEKLLNLKRVVVERVMSLPSLSIYSFWRMSRKSAEEIQSVRGKVENVKSALSEARGVCEELRRRDEAHKNARPDMADDESPEAVDARLQKLGADINSCVARIAVIDESFRRDRELRERLAGIISEIDRQKAVLADWQQLDRYFGSADGRQFSKIALRYVLGHLLDKANVYLQKIMPRYRLHCRTDSFIIMVEDAYQNGAMRSANVISGGESFIVSLVLALALSDVGSSLKVDILFIDEGFGTLSGDALESAVETLRTLHSRGGRRVGIISHVAELRERIPVKICVTREGQAPSAVSVELS